MTQYDERVEMVRQRQAAEAWANGVKCLHSHQIKSMWYDDRPQDTDDGPVMDVQSVSYTHLTLPTIYSV